MKILTNLDLGKNQILNVTLQKLATAPEAPSSGQIYYNTGDKRPYIWTGAAWVGMDAADATMSGSDIVAKINLSSSIIEDKNLSQAVRNAISKSHDTHTILDIEGLSEALDDKADKSQVLTSVPANAKFTDTTYNKATTSVDGLMSKEDKTKLDDISPNAEENLVNSVAGRTGEIVLTKSDVGLSNVNNTSDLNKPISSATAAALNSKAEIEHTHEISGVVGLQGQINSKANVVHTHDIEDISGLETALSGKETPSGAQEKANTAKEDAVTTSKNYTDTIIEDLIGAAPEDLDTLHELAQALQENVGSVETILTELGKKVNKYSQMVGNNIANSIVVTHNLNTRDVIVQLRKTGSPYEVVYTDVQITSLNTITLLFAEAPGTNAYTVTITG